jgi:hypothetical protein
MPLYLSSPKIVDFMQSFALFLEYSRTDLMKLTIWINGTCSQSGGHECKGQDG